MEADCSLVGRVLRPLFPASCKSGEVEQWCARFQHYLSSSYPSGLLHESLDEISLRAARTLRGHLRGADKRNCFLPNLELCSIHGVTASTDREITTGTILKESEDSMDRTAGGLVEKQSCLLIGFLTTSPGLDDSLLSVYGHTPGSLFLSDSTTCVLTEVIRCRPEWLEALVIIPSWHYVPCAEAPAVIRDGRGGREVVSSGYIEVTAPCLVVARSEPPSASLEESSLLDVSQLARFTTEKGVKHRHFNVRGVVNARSPIQSNGPGRSPYFLVDLLDTGGICSVTIVVQRQNLLHWAHLLALESWVVFTSLVQAQRRGGSAKGRQVMLATTSKSELHHVTDEGGPRQLISESSQSGSVLNTQQLIEVSQSIQPNALRDSLQQVGCDSDHLPSELLLPKRKKTLGKNERTPATATGARQPTSQSDGNSPGIGPPSFQPEKTYPMVTYEGVVTNSSQGGHGVFQLDNCAWVYCCHQNCPHWCRGWRVGASVRLTNAHLVPASSATGNCAILACCAVTTAEVVKFSCQNNIGKCSGATRSHSQCSAVLSVFAALQCSRWQVFTWSAEFVWCSWYSWIFGKGWQEYCA